MVRQSQRQRCEPVLVFIHEANSANPIVVASKDDTSRTFLNMVVAEVSKNCGISKYEHRPIWDPTKNICKPGCAEVPPGQAKAQTKCPPMA